MKTTLLVLGMAGGWLALKAPPPVVRPVPPAETRKVSVPAAQPVPDRAAEEGAFEEDCG